MIDSPKLMLPADRIVELHEKVLVTGAAGFIGRNVVRALRRCGFTNVHCLVRPTGDADVLSEAGVSVPAALKIQRGNLLSREDCANAARDAAVIFHLAAGTGGKSYADAYLNSVVTTRNLIEAALDRGSLRRLVSISSFAVYSNQGNKIRGLLDEDCPVETEPVERGEAYCFAKLKQDELIVQYAKTHGLRYVLLRPGVVYGPGKCSISGRVGRNVGIFLHFGGGNPLPLSYVENCSDAIVLAGVVKDVDNEIFNVLDDDIPSCRWFLKMYKRRVRRFPSIYIPKPAARLFCSLWEKYSYWSKGQLPPVFNRRAWHAYWKGSRYTNARLKSRLGWIQGVPTPQALERFWESCREARHNA